MSKEIENNYGDKFFYLDKKICFIQKRGVYRIEVEPEKFFEAEKMAKEMFDENKYEDEKDIILLKIRQLLKDETLSFVDKINLQAAETFPNNKYFRRLLLRDLSVDIPEVKLNPTEKNELNKALKSKTP